MPARDPGGTTTRRVLLNGAFGAVGAGLAVAAGPSAEAASAPAKASSRVSGPDGMYAASVRDAMWAYRDKGAGPPAVFLHPFLLNSNMWTDQLNGLGDIRRCIAPDMRGWGRSEPVTDTYLDVEKYADDIVRFLDVIGVTQPVDLIGLSVGGFLCGLVYERIPARVASITLLSAVFDFERDIPYERYQRELARMAVVEGKDAVFRRLDEYIDGPHSSLHVRARYHQMLLDSRTEMLVAQLTEGGRTTPRPDLPAKIKVPILIPIGAEDSVITPARADGMSKVFPDAAVVRVKGAGRLLPIESPAELNNALRDFWNGRGTRRT